MASRDAITRADSADPRGSPPENFRTGPTGLLFWALLLALFSWASFGCSRSPRSVKTQHSGDFGQFILQSVQSYGGHVKRTENLPPIQVKWEAEETTGSEYLADRTQLYIRLKGGCWEEITNHLTQALGLPSNPASNSQTGVLHGYYTMGDIGVGLQFYRSNEEMGFILVGTPRR